MSGQQQLVNVVDGTPGKPVIGTGQFDTYKYLLQWSMTGVTGSSWEAYVNGGKVGTRNLTGGGTNLNVLTQSDSAWLDLPAGTHTLMVRLRNAAGYTDSVPVTITMPDTAPGAAILNNIWDNRMVTSGQTYSVAWSTLGMKAQSGVLYFDGQEVARFSGSNFLSSGSLNWTPTASTGNDYKKLVLKLCNGTQCTNGSEMSVRVSDGTPGKAAIVGNATVTLGSDYLLSWNRTEGLCATSWQLYKVVNGVSTALGTEKSLTSCSNSAVAQTGSVVLKTELTKGANVFFVRLFRTDGSNKGSTDSATFTVTANETPPPTPVVPTAPVLSVNQASIATGGNVTFTMTAPAGSYQSWQLKEGANSYTGGAITTSGTVQTSSYTITLSQARDYGFSVRAFVGPNATGTFIDSSPEILVKVRDVTSVPKTNKPVLQPPTGSVVFGNAVPVNWLVMGGGAPDTVKLYVNKGQNGAQTLDGSGITPSATGWSGSFSIKTLNVGTHALQVEICNVQGCVLSDTQSVSVVVNTSNLVKPNITSNPPATLSKGSNHLLKWEALTTGATNWQVFNGTQAMTDLLPPTTVAAQGLQKGEVNLSFAQAGQYKLTLKLCNANQQCVISDEKSINVTDGSNNAYFPPNKPVLNLPATTVRAAQSASFFWVSNDNLSPLQNVTVKQGNQVLYQEVLAASQQKNYSKNFSLTWPQAGSYELVLTVCNANGCTSGDAVSVNVATSDGQNVGGVPDKPVFDQNNPKRIDLGNAVSLTWSIKPNGLKGEYWRYMQRDSGSLSDLSAAIPIEVNSPSTAKRYGSLSFFSPGTKTVIVRTCLVDKCTDSDPYELLVVASATDGGSSGGGSGGGGRGGGGRISDGGSGSASAGNAPYPSQSSTNNVLNPGVNPYGAGPSRAVPLPSVGAVPPDAVGGFGAFQQGNATQAFAAFAQSDNAKPPGKPVIRPLSNQSDARFSVDNLLVVQWTRSEGAVANDWSLMMNGNYVVNRQPLRPQQIQSGTASLPALVGGNNSVVVQLCNANGCTSSDYLNLNAQASALNAMQRAPDPATLLPNTQWAGDRVMVHWRAGSVPGEQVEIMINGRSMEGRINVRPVIGQSGSHMYFFPGEVGMQQAMVSVMLCNAHGCTPSPPYALSKFGAR